MNLGPRMPQTSSGGHKEGPDRLKRFMPQALVGPGRRPAWQRTKLRRVVSAVLVATAVWVATSGFLPKAAPAGEPIVVVAQDLMAGHVLTGDDLVVAHWPANLSPHGSTGDPGSLEGRSIGAAMSRGEPVTAARVRGPGLLTGAPMGMVAAHVRLADPAMATMTADGDHVDLISPGGKLVASDVAVLAVDPSTAGTGGWSTTPASSSPSGVIVAVAPDAAARLATVDPSGQVDDTFTLVMRGPRT
jgi:pilus assembly protein CpaB